MTRDAFPSLRRRVQARLGRALLAAVGLALLLGTERAFAQGLVDVDVCIYGGTSSGVIAAYAAQQYGRSVVLIEPGRHLGGLSAGGLGQTDIGNKYAITGLARDFYRRVGTHYGRFEAWQFEPHVAEAVFAQYVGEAGVDVRFARRLKSVRKEGAWLREIVLEDAGSPGEAADLVVRAKVFIDASYEGDLMARAGVSYAVGREANSVYGETWNGVQLLEGHQFPDGVDPYVVPGDYTSGLLPEITGVGAAPRGTGDGKVQAYNFRMCLCRDEQNRLPLPRPARYDPGRYALLLRLLEKQQPTRLNDLFIISPMPNGKTDWNNRGGFSTDYIGESWDYPEADYARRAEIWQAHVDYQQGLLYFLAHDERVPAALRAEMQAWGPCRDEFTDNGGWPHQLYVREARRMIGETVMTQHHCTGEEVVDDGVGMAAYTMDSHNVQRVVVGGMVKNEGNVEVGIGVPYPIAYRAITPKRAEAANLLVPVALSASHIAYGSIRMEPVFMVLGQSAALAASMALAAGTPVQDVDVAALQQSLRDNPLADSSTAEILLDNADAEHVQTLAYWDTWTNQEAQGVYGPDVLNDGGTRADGAVRFNAPIKRAGAYDVYLYWPAVREGGPPAATNATVDVRFNGGGKVVKVDQRAQSQTWVLLGTFPFAPGHDAYVEIRNDGADGVVLADAVLLRPVGAPSREEDP